MNYEWDDDKNRQNKTKHSIGFEEMQRFDWSAAVTEIDDREDYGELRETAAGFIGVSLFHVTFVWIDEDTMRIISLRKATNKEKKQYVRDTEQ